MKLLHSTSAVIEGGAGLGLLLQPSVVVWLLLGVPVETPMAATLARVAGVALLALGVACWRTRQDEGAAARGVASAMLVYNSGVTTILTGAAVGHNLNGIALWAAVVLHGLMSIWCIVRLGKKTGLEKPRILFLAVLLAALLPTARPLSAAEPALPMVASTFAPTVANSAKAPGPAPKGMVWIPGGEFSMGANGLAKDTSCCSEGAVADTAIHRVYVDGFWMDTTEVTNAQFAEFVKATSYVTVAEIAPTQEQFPTAAPENLVAGAVVFNPPDAPVPLNDHFQWWSYIKGANWRHPEGPESNIKGRENYPVVQIAYPDAVAYAKWAGKRLPTESEWEFAQRGGLSGKLYAWGDEFKPGGKFMANTYQGKFPVKDTGEDGFVGLAPVKSFPPNGYGLYDTAGNVWEWCSDWYRPVTYSLDSVAGKALRNPQGPDSSNDPSEPGMPKRVQRGGSYLCTDQYCSRYMVGTRGKGDPDTATNHLGFRCVKTP